jgi:hypothetical protein
MVNLIITDVAYNLRNSKITYASRACRSSRGTLDVVHKLLMHPTPTEESSKFNYYGIRSVHRGGPITMSRASGAFVQSCRLTCQSFGLSQDIKVLIYITSDIY